MSSGDPYDTFVILPSQSLWILIVFGLLWATTPL